MVFKGVEIKKDDVREALRELDVWFWGDEKGLDDLILSYLKTNPKNGMTSAQLIVFFVYEKELCNRRTLLKRLEMLLKHDDVVVDNVRGLNFYKIKTEE